MLPASYATPAAVILTVGGLLSCFAGYRLFRFVLGLYGFILGAMVTTSFMGTTSTMSLVLAALAGGVVGAVLMIVAYFTGVGLIGAGLAALALHLVWRFVGGDPPTVVLVIVCVLGALGALSVARWVVIIGTSLAGAWTLIVGASALLGHPAALHAASAGTVWLVYPLSGGWMYSVMGFALAGAGAIVQLGTSAKGGARKKIKRPAA
ncbi:MAG: DUF4203 domain-containing protein [Vicinamibacterales bacterium]